MTLDFVLDPVDLDVIEFIPHLLCFLDIRILGCLVPSQQQNDDRCTAQSVIHTVGWSIVQPEFPDTITHRFMIAKVSFLHPVQSRKNFGCCQLVLLYDFPESRGKLFGADDRHLFIVYAMAYNSARGGDLEKFCIYLDFIVDKIAQHVKYYECREGEESKLATHKTKRKTP